MPGQPGSAGAINSDFDKQGKSVDDYEIRVSVTEGGTAKCWKEAISPSNSIKLTAEHRHLSFR